MNEKIYKTYKEKPNPSARSIEDALKAADAMRRLLPERVVVFAEDWDLVILADELKRLRNIH